MVTLSTASRKGRGAPIPRTSRAPSLWPNCTACIASEDADVEHAFRDPDSLALGSAYVVAMQQMQAAGIEAFGAEVRMLELAAPASPAPDEVGLSVRAAGVGHCDESV